jgi:peptidoglycan/LPS O-acetylase OafA/YrhL
MGITQVGAIKALPYIASNVLSLLTCFPLAVIVIVAASWFMVVFRNRFLIWIGSISYEVYLVHAFTLTLIAENLCNIVSFVFLTVVLAVILHWVIKRGINNGGFNRSNPHEK